MAQHEVELKLAHPVPIGKVDIEIPVKRDDKPLGRLKISRGGLDWIPTPKAKSGFRVDWADLDALMQQYGRPIK